MAWVDRHPRPLRLRNDVWSAFQRDWTVEIPSQTEQVIALSKGADRLVFAIAANYPFVAPSVAVNGTQCPMHNDAWFAAQTLDAYADDVLCHAALMSDIRGRSPPPRDAVSGSLVPC